MSFNRRILCALLVGVCLQLSPVEPAAADPRTAPSQSEEAIQSQTRAFVAQMTP